MSTAPAISTKKKIGSSTGGTSHSRMLNLSILDISAAFSIAAGAQRSQSPMTAGEARGDTEHMVTLRRITRPASGYLFGWGSSRVVILFRRSHLSSDAMASPQVGSHCAKLSPRRILSAISANAPGCDVRVTIGGFRHDGTAPRTPTI